jgi:hypothetical protein
MHRWHAEAFSAKTFFGWRGGIGGLEEERQVIIPGGLSPFEVRRQECMVLRR